MPTLIQTAMDRRRLSRLRFYGVVAVLVVSVWGFQHYMYLKIFGVPGTIFSASSAAPSSPSDWQKMSVDAMTDTNALLTTLATALLGAIGFMLLQQQSLPSRHLWAGFLAAICGGVSLYFGYSSHLNLLAMINYQTFIDPYESVYQFSSHAQFYSLLAGAFFFADFAFHELSKDE